LGKIPIVLRKNRRRQSLDKSPIDRSLVTIIACRVEAIYKVHTLASFGEEHQSDSTTVSWTYFSHSPAEPFHLGNFLINIENRSDIGNCVIDTSFCMRSP